MGIAGLLARAGACAALAVAGLAGTASAAPYLYSADNNGEVDLFSVDPVNGGLTDEGTQATLGLGPRDVQVSPDARTVYVLGSGQDRIHQFRAAADGTLTPLAPASVPTGDFPLGMAIAPDGRHAYVTAGDSATLHVYDVAADGTLTAHGAPVSTGSGSWGVAVSPDGASLYVARQIAGTIAQYDVAGDGTVTPKAGPDPVTPGSPISVTPSHDGASVYVAAAGGDTYQFDVAADGRLTPKATPSIADAASAFMALTPDGTRLFGGRAGGVARFTVGAGGALTREDPAADPATTAQDVAIAPAGTSLYTADGTTAAIRQYTVTGAALAAKTPASLALPTGRTPKALAITPQSDLAVTQSAPSASPDRDVVYTITATNVGGTPASEVEVQTSMPADLTFVSATAPDGTCTQQPDVTCRFAWLEQGASATVTIRARAVRTGSIATTATVSALQPDPVAANDGDTTTLTVVPRPGATTAPATAVGTGAATLNAVVAPAGTNTRYRFEYGTSAAYGTSTAPVAVAGPDPGLVSRDVTGLQPATTYHVRVVAENDEGSLVTGEDRTFTTAAVPAPVEPLVRTVTVTREIPVPVAGPSAAADRTAPALTAVKLSATSLRFRVSEAATVRGTIAVRRTTRVRRGGRTRTTSRWVTAGRVRTKAGAGTGSVKLARRLPHGRYRVTVTATDAAGNASAPRTASLTLKR